MRHGLIAVLLVCAMCESAVAAQTTRRRAVRHPGASARPVAAPDTYSVTQGSTLTIEAPGILANDSLNGASLSSYGPLTGTEQQNLGSALLTSNGATLTLASTGGFTYIPSTSFSGTDTFRYVIRNADGSSSAAVTIMVDAAAEASAVGDSYTTAPEASLTVPAPGVLTNDILSGGEIASFGPKTGTEQTSLTASSPTARSGTISLRQDGSFEYTPPPSEDDGYGYVRPFLGRDTFSYVIRSGQVSSTALVEVSVEVQDADADFVVTTPGHYYAISGLPGENPALELKRGTTYVFRISASAIHPFAILDAPAASVTNNNITEGTLTFTVPMTAASYRYRCTTHLFGNIITTVP